jgi:multidrug efflux pump
VLVAVFVPLAFITGLTGQFYRQFALTIADLHGDLGDQLAHALACPRGAAAQGPRRAQGPPHGVHGPRVRLALRGFNKVFGRGAKAYTGGVTRALSRKALFLGVYLVLAIATAGLFKAVPSGFVPGRTSST